ncbi:hypothetical protein FORC83_p003 (plasmid) [Campylobacter jejuni]|nr:hypothetical protein FORC83_p003 [Campylobacter jejuni]
MFEYIKVMNEQEKHDQLTLLLNSYLMFLIGQGMLKDLASLDGLEALNLKIKTLNEFVNKNGIFPALDILEAECNQAKANIARREKRRKNGGRNGLN